MCVCVGLAAACSGLIAFRHAAAAQLKRVSQQCERLAGNTMLN